MCLGVDEEIFLGSDEAVADILAGLKQAEKAQKKSEQDAVANPYLSGLADLQRQTVLKAARPGGGTCGSIESKATSKKASSEQQAFQRY